MNSGIVNINFGRSLGNSNEIIAKLKGVLFLTNPKSEIELEIFIPDSCL